MCIYIWIYFHQYILLCVGISTCLCFHMYVLLCVCIAVCMYVLPCVCMWNMNVKHVHVSVCIYFYIIISPSLCTFAVLHHSCVCMCVCLRVCVCGRFATRMCESVCVSSVRVIYIAIGQYMEAIAVYLYTLTHSHTPIYIHSHTHTHTVQRWSTMYTTNNEFCCIYTCVCIFVFIHTHTHTYTHTHTHTHTHMTGVTLHMKISTHNATPLKSTRSRISDSSVSCATNSNWDFGLI